MLGHAGTLAIYQTTRASCTDGVQNEGEQGVDCGGHCDRTCCRYGEVAHTCTTGVIAVLFVSLFVSLD